MPAGAPVDYTDRRFNQTTDRYAAEDLETIEVARRYGEHVFSLFRPYIGRRVRFRSDAVRAWIKSGLPAGCVGM